jgi:hypothetical protein
MDWNRRYNLRNSLRASLWIIPLIAIPFAVAAARLTPGAATKTQRPDHKARRTS